MRWQVGELVRASREDRESIETDVAALADDRAAAAASAAKWESEYVAFVTEHAKVAAVRLRSPFVLPDDAPDEFVAECEADIGVWLADIHSRGATFERLMARLAADNAVASQLSQQAERLSQDLEASEERLSDARAATKASSAHVPARLTGSRRVECGAVYRSLAAGGALPLNPSTVGRALRLCGLNPTEAAIDDAVAEAHTRAPGVLSLLEFELMAAAVAERDPTPRDLRAALHRLCPLDGDGMASADDLLALLRARGEPLEMAEEEQAVGDPMLGLDGDRFRPTDVIAAILATSAKQ